MSTTIWAEGGFIIIKDATHEEQIPLNSFMFNFVGLTDDVRLFAIQTPEQAFFVNYTNLIDSNGSPIGNTKAEALTYLRALPVQGITGGAVTVVANQTDFSTSANQSAALTELSNIKAELNAIKAQIDETAIDQTFARAFSGNDVINLGLPSGTMGEISSITGYSSGSVVFVIDGSTPDNTNSPRITSRSASFNPIKNIDLSLFRIKGTSSGSRYYIIYSIYK